MGPRSAVSRLAAAALLLVATAACVCLAQTPPEASICYLLFGGVDDLGYTFSFNDARLKIHEALERELPGRRVTSYAVPNVFFMRLLDQEATLASLVRRGCHIIAANNWQNVLKGDFRRAAQMYPNVTFFAVPQQIPLVFDRSEPNFVPMVQVPRQAFYLKGATAARQASRCIGIITAFEEPGNAVDAVNGAVRGIRDENDAIPIHVVTMNSWYWPEGEVDAATLLTDRIGCDVVVRFTDSRHVDEFVAGLPESRGVFSVGVHADLQRYVGDSVLVSSYVAWDKSLTSLFAQALRDGRPSFGGAPYAFANGTVVTSELSPRSSQVAREAFERGKRRLEANPDVYCGVLRLRNGTVVNSDPSQCLNLTTQTALFLDAPHTVFHGIFRHRTECSAGSYASYAVAPEIALTCTPCPANTFAATAGQLQCAACLNGTVAVPGSAECHVAPREDDRSLAVWAIVVVVIAAVFCVIATFRIYQIVAARLNARRHDVAPKRPPLCILFTDIESSTELWQAHDRMGEAVETHHRVIREVLLEYGGYEVKTVGDSFMIAVAGVVDAVMIAVAIQRRLHTAKWPESMVRGASSGPLFNGPKICIGVHYCEEVEPKYEAERDYWDYYGPDVNVAARIQSEAKGGQILVSDAAVIALREDAAFDPLVAPDVSMQLFARNVQLKNCPDAVTLYSVVPVELAERQQIYVPGAGVVDSPHAGSPDGDVCSESLPPWHDPQVPDTTTSGSDDRMSFMCSGQRLAGPSPFEGPCASWHLFVAANLMLAKCRVHDRSAIARTLATAWAPHARKRPIAQQLRAVALATAAAGASPRPPSPDSTPSMRSNDSTQRCDPRRAPTIGERYRPAEMM